MSCFLFVQEIVSVEHLRDDGIHTMEENVIVKLVCINTSAWIVFYPDVPPNFHGKVEFAMDCDF